MKLGERIAEKRREQGMTQAELAEQMMVTRQTVSRWEAGSALPDVTKIAELAAILGVSCDYLLTDINQNVLKGEPSNPPVVSRLLEELIGKMVKFNFYDEEVDADIMDKPCRILGFEGNWMVIQMMKRNEVMRKLIAISTIVSIEIIEE